MKVLGTNICVIGLGYIGLPTASLLATKGYKVRGVDISQSIVDTINNGEIHIAEPDLDILVKSAVQSGNLHASLEPNDADIFIIAVPTPFKDGKQPDLSHVEDAARKISPYLKNGGLVILESTCPVGTTEERVAHIFKQDRHKLGEEVFVAYCPERVLPGRILSELVENDRIVGGIDKLSTEHAMAFYKTFIQGEVLATDSRTAELAKVAENSFRDVNIAFANELSLICHEEGIDVWELIELANRHPRVDILKPGPGVGGHCIAVDPWFIVARNPDQANLIRTAREVNDGKPGWVVEKVKSSAANFKRPVIACLGLAFKADIDDLRESPALDIVTQLKNQNVGEILVCEPNIDNHDNFDLVSLEDAIPKADIVLVLVNHKQFYALNPEDLKDKIVIDTRGVFA